MNTTLTHKLCSSVRKHTVPPPEGKVCTTRTEGYDVSNPALQPTHKRVLHNVVRRWFFRSINKSGQCFEALEMPNLMDDVNGNAT